jgi:hypothetical protein
LIQVRDLGKRVVHGQALFSLYVGIIAQVRRMST